LREKPLPPARPRTLFGGNQAETDLGPGRRLPTPAEIPMFDDPTRAAISFFVPALFQKAGGPCNSTSNFSRISHGPRPFPRNGR